MILFLMFVSLTCMLPCVDQTEDKVNFMNFFQEASLPIWEPYGHHPLYFFFFFLGRLFLDTLSAAENQCYNVLLLRKHASVGT